MPALTLRMQLMGYANAQPEYFIRTSALEVVRVGQQPFQVPAKIVTHPAKNAANKPISVLLATAGSS